VTRPYPKRTAANSSHTSWAWEMSVSFRPAQPTCAGESREEAVLEAGRQEREGRKGGSSVQRSLRGRARRSMPSPVLQHDTTQTRVPSAPQSNMQRRQSSLAGWLAGGRTFAAAAAHNDVCHASLVSRHALLIQHVAGAAAGRAGRGRSKGRGSAGVESAEKGARGGRNHCEHAALSTGAAAGRGERVHGWLVPPE
jgi:hypothetical protein